MRIVGTEAVDDAPRDVVAVGIVQLQAAVGRGVVEILSVGETGDEADILGSGRRGRIGRRDGGSVDGDVVEEEGIHIVTDVAEHDIDGVAGSHGEGCIACGEGGGAQGLAENQVVAGKHLVALGIVALVGTRFPAEVVVAGSHDAGQDEVVVGLDGILDESGMRIVGTEAVDDAPRDVVAVGIVQLQAAVGRGVVEILSVGETGDEADILGSGRRGRIGRRDGDSVDGDVVEEEGIHIVADVAEHDIDGVAGSDREGGVAGGEGGGAQGLAENQAVAGKHLVSLGIVALVGTCFPAEAVVAGSHDAGQDEVVVGLDGILDEGGMRIVGTETVNDTPRDVVTVDIEQPQTTIGRGVVEILGVGE